MHGHFPAVRIRRGDLSLARRHGDRLRQQLDCRALRAARRSVRHGAGAAREVGSVGWDGRELVAFRLHLPSKIRYHNTKGIESRGNILAWEQPLADRLHGAPLTLDARMDTQSILYRTLWLFAATFL